MNKKLILLLIVLVVFTSASLVSAIDYTTLKNPDNFKAFDNTGVSEKETDGRVQLSVVPVNDKAISYITGNGEKSDDNIYKYVDMGYSAKDDKFGYEGYTEVIEIDGEQFIVSVLFDSKMSPSEEKEFLNALTQFNEKNKFDPVQLN